MLGSKTTKLISQSLPSKSFTISKKNVFTHWAWSRTMKGLKCDPTCKIKLWACHNFMDVGRNQEMPRSETTDAITHSTASSTNFTVTLGLMPLIPTQVKRRGPRKCCIVSQGNSPLRRPKQTCLTLPSIWKHYFYHPRMLAIQTNHPEETVQTKDQLVLFL